MKKPITTWMTWLAATVLSYTVHAQNKPSAPTNSVHIRGSYQASFEEVANNCETNGIKLHSETIRIEQSRKRNRKTAIQVYIPSLPKMNGTVRRGGKIRAKSSKGPVANSKLLGSFTLAGRADGKTIQLIFIADFYQGNKPLCTQSWNVSGKK